MKDYRTSKPQAIMLAESLFRTRGAIAFDVAQHRRLAAIADGRIARADLYQAICTVLGDRDRVFTRLKRPER